MYANSDRFLTAFNRIEKELRLYINQTNGIGFSKMVRILRKSNAIIERFSEDLLEFAELRNAIVHNKIDMTYAIAEPHDSVVARIEKMEKELVEPQKVNQAFMKKVVSFQQDETLANLLHVINKTGLTKFPIHQHGAFRGLITHKAITLWLSKSMHTGYTLPEKTTLEEIIACEKADNYRFISQDMNVLEATEIFRKQVGQGNRIEALLITKKGKPNEKLLGIITNWDIMRINSI